MVQRSLTLAKGTKIIFFNVISSTRMAPSAITILQSTSLRIPPAYANLDPSLINDDGDTGGDNDNQDLNIDPNELLALKDSVRPPKRPYDTVYI